MKIEKKGVKIELNKPAVNFDAIKLGEVEAKKAKKQKALLITTTALTIGAAVLSKGLKAKKKISAKKK